jgi:predicted nucleotidyltransferase
MMVTTSLKMSDESLRRLQIATCIAEEYKKINGIDSIAVEGSTALGTAYSESDIDMVVTYSESPNNEERQKAIRKIVNQYGNEPQPGYVIMGQADGFCINGIDVSIILGHNDYLLQYPNTRQKSMGTSNEIEIFGFQNNIVLYDPKAIWKHVKEELDNYPIDIGEKIIGENLDKIIVILDDIIKAIITQDEFTHLEAQYDALQAFLRILFAINKSYYRRFKDLSISISSFANIPKNCESRLREWAKEHCSVRLRLIILDFLRDIIPLIEIYPGISADKKTHHLRRISRAINAT